MCLCVGVALRFDFGKSFKSASGEREQLDETSLAHQPHTLREVLKPEITVQRWGCLYSAGVCQAISFALQRAAALNKNGKCM